MSLMSFVQEILYYRKFEAVFASFFLKPGKFIFFGFSCTLLLFSVIPKNIRELGIVLGFQ